RVYWLPNGVDPGYYDPSADKKNWRGRNGFSEEDKLFFYGGIIGHAQGLEVILKAAEKLRDQKKIKFILMGEGPVKEELLRMKKEQKLENVFFFPAVGKIDMPSVVGSMDAALIPLKKLDLFKGAIPSKIFESLAMKKPILLGVEGEAKELFIDEGKCGLAFEPENADDLAKVVLQFCSDEQLQRTMGEHARAYVIKKFSRDTIAAGFIEELEKLRSGVGSI
ncbi:MAG TPA: glycosyltransferase family 4 protein, partial [Bacteroidia bacterium]|nr:glycosyltransferase family 4 protein [Bacteroidia bacterium]